MELRFALPQSFVKWRLRGYGKRDSQKLRDGGGDAKVGDRAQIHAGANMRSGGHKERLHLRIVVAVAVASRKGIGILRERTVFAGPEGIVGFGGQVEVG